MKQTSTQISDDSFKDDLFNLFAMEVQNRGIRYLNLYKGIDQSLTPELIPKLLLQLAVQPSLVTIFSHDDPIRALEDTITGDFTDGEIAFINDFLDDISINVRLKATELYNGRLAELKVQIHRSVVAQNGMRDRGDIVNNAIARVEHNLLAYYYLRKIGYTNA